MCPLLSLFSRCISLLIEIPLKCNLRFFLRMYVIRLHRIRISWLRYKGERGMEEDPRMKTLKCKFDLISWVVIIMHITRFNLINSILAHEIYFRMSIIMPYG